MNLEEFCEKAKSTVNTGLVVVGFCFSLSTLIKMIRSVGAEKRIKSLIFQISHRNWCIAKGMIPQIYQAVSKSKYPIFLQPTLHIFKKWKDQLAFIKEFSAYPIVPQVFSSAEFNGDRFRLSFDRIDEIMSVSDVRGLAIHEIISWYNEYPPLPESYIMQLLDYVKSHNIFLMWNEWWIDAFPKIRELIKGYEDHVVVTFGTNSGQVEPVIGYDIARRSPRWGASVQAWYWRTRHPESNVLDMPINLLIEHTKQAISRGAEYVQYEPYWYLFDSGHARPSLNQLLEGLI